MRSLFGGFLVLALGLSGIICSCKKTGPQQQGAVAPAAPPAASAPVSAPAVAGPAPERFALPGEAPGDVRLALAGDASDGIVRRLTDGWSSGKVAFVPDRLVFTIARDYDQVAAVQIRNLSDQRQSVRAVLRDFGDGLIGDFSGDGAVRPVELAAGQATTLSLHLFAQDATRANYRSALVVSDALSGVALAVAPVTVFIRQASLTLRVTVGVQDPATLAREVTVQNTGETLTDFTVKPDGALAATAMIEPIEEHVLLQAGANVSFRVAPVLSTDFAGLAGPIVLSGAGQQQRVDISLPIGQGKHVFVASSFSSSNDQADGGYCTNNPNTNTHISGPNDPYPLIGYDPDDPLQKSYHDGTPASGGSGNGDDKSLFDKFNDWMNSHVPALPIPGLPIDSTGRGSFDKNFGPVEIKGDYGPAPGSDPSGPLVDIHWTVSTAPMPGIPPTSFSGTTTVSISQNVQNNLDPSNPANPGGAELNGAAQPQSGGGAQGGPRGLRVRPAYASFRLPIYLDNEPESACDVGPGAPSERDVLQVWHSDRWCGVKGRQILLRVWDGLGRHPITRPIAISSKTLYGQWPTVLALPAGQVLIVWESATQRGQPPSLMYRFGGNGFASWTPAAPLTGADSSAGNYDPQAILTPEGNVLILWQRGTDRQARLMLTRSDGHGTFAPAVAPQGLPAGVARPTARFLPNGNLCLVFQAPPLTAEGGVETAVFAALSKDGGSNFGNVTRLSHTSTDAGEADLLVNGKTVEVAMRTGPSWQSSIALDSSVDGATTWSPPRVVSDPSIYCEYPTLTRTRRGAELSFYGDVRPNTSPAQTPGTGPVAGAPFAGTVLKRYAIYRNDDGAFAPMRRLLTHFPTSRIGWLQVNFRLRFPRRDFTPHEISILLNGVALMHQTDAIPEGNYLLPFDPALLAEDAQGRPHNIISLRTVHMNPGHYASAAQFRLQVHHRFLERFTVAETQEQADALAARETDEVNHARPDVGIFARPSTRPVLVPATPLDGQIITIGLTVANLGESPARNVKVRTYAGGNGDSFQSTAVGDEIDLGTLNPFDLKDVDVKFPYGGAAAYRAVVSSDAGDPAKPAAAGPDIAPNQRDFDLSNNVFQVSFAAPRAPSIVARQPEPSADLVADLDDDPAPPAEWRVLDSASGKQVATVTGGHTSVSIPPGRYKLALKRYPFDGEEMIFPAVYEKKPGQPIEATLRTSIEIEPAPEMTSVFQWQAMDAGHADHVVQRLSGSHPVMLLPPGDYHVAILPSQFDSSWVSWPQTIHLEEGQRQALKLDTGVIPPDRMASIPSPFSWGLWLRGKPDAKPVQQMRGAWIAICVPPGKYQWGIQLSQYNSTIVVFPEVLDVEAGKIVRPQMPGIVALLPMQWSVPYLIDINDGGTGRLVEEITNGAAMTALLPPGEYSVAIQPFRWNCMKITLPGKFGVTSGGTLRMPLDSGIDVEPAKTGRREPPPYQLSFTRDGDAKPTQSLAATNWGPVYLPPGRYRAALRPRQWQGQEVMWPTMVNVVPGQLSIFTIDSGIHLTGLSPEQAKGLRVRIVSLSSRAIPQIAAATQPASGLSEVVIAQSDFDAMQTQWLPPAKYSVQIQNNANVWQTAADDVQVTAGQTIDVPIKAPVAPTPAAGSGTGTRRN